MNSFRPVIVREIVQRTFSDLSRQKQTCLESLLIKDGFYCGYRYSFGEFSAIWFVEEEQIKFYNSAGRTIRTICPNETTRKMAA